MRIATIVLAIAAIATLAPLWLPLVLALWVADLLQAPARRLERLLGGRRRSAAAVIVMLALAVLVPLAFTVAAVVATVQELIEQGRVALEGNGPIRGLFAGGPPAGRLTIEDLATMASRYGADAWRMVNTVARASVTIALGVLVFVVALYTSVSSGEHAYAWFERNLPIPPRAFARLAAAFQQTGRGLLVGSGGTALAQGAVATISYVAIGIPRAFVLGALTTVCALIPVIGTGLVWIPLAVELALSGQAGRAALVAVIGLGVIGLIDNLLRPVLTRFGRLELPASVVLLSMIGGAAAFGPSGALLGPLVMRMAVEAFAILREDDHVPPAAPGGAAPP